MNISENDVSMLRSSVMSGMSEKRYQHTLGVERMARFLASHLLPDRVEELAAAALLHDISKEIPIDVQIEMLEKDGFQLTDEDIKTPGVIHSFSGPVVIKNQYYDFASDDVLKAVRSHTIGAETMSVFDKIIFVSDYTEDTRTYQSCIEVRNFLISGFENLSYEDKLKRLNKACALSIQGTIDAILRAGKPINSRIKNAQNPFLT